MADTREFQAVLEAHLSKYPWMEPQDCGKLAYQNALGPAHLLSHRERFSRLLRDEWEAVDDGGPSQPPESIGNGLCRFPLTKTEDLEAATPLLARLCLLTAERGMGAMSQLMENLACLERVKLPGMSEWLTQYRGQGCPAIHHSPAYRAAYRPHYRLLRVEYAGYFPALLQIAKRVREGASAVVAIDGRCGSGKTQLAELIHTLFPCNLIHMDDYYLPPQSRTQGWERRPGGNMDFDRMLGEVLDPLRAGNPAVYRPFDCQTGQYGPKKLLPPLPLTVVEGSYSQHPRLAARYDMRIFLTCAKRVQMCRLKRREGGHFLVFERRWIPMEENYIRSCAPDCASDWAIDTSGFFEGDLLAWPDGKE